MEPELREARRCYFCSRWAAGYARAAYRDRDGLGFYYFMCGECLRKYAYFIGDAYSLAQGERHQAEVAALSHLSTPELLARGAQEARDAQPVRRRAPHPRRSR